MEKTSADAVTALREAGLKLGKISRKETDTYPVNTVIAQSIRSGEEVARNTAVDIVVAVKPGSQPAARPDSTQGKSPSGKAQ
jgi:serine/threonine-protein kinase